MFNYMNSLQAPISDTVYVVNRNDNIVRKYQISKEYALGSCPPSPEDCLTETEMIPMTVEQSVIQYVSVASQAPQIDISLNPSLGFPDSAYDAVEWPQKTANLASWIETQPIDLLQDLINVTNVVNPIAHFNPEAVRMPIRVHLPNGDLVTFHWDPQQNKFVRTPGQTYDNNGNRVPETREDVAGGVGNNWQYEFDNDESLSEWLQRMIALGIPVTGPIQNTTIKVYICTSEYKNGRWTVSCRSVIL